VFFAGLVGIGFLLTAVIFFQKVIGDDPANPAWRAGFDRYAEIEQTLPDIGVQPTDVLIVNNPPGLYIASRRASIVVPDGTVQTVLEVGQRYNATYLLLDENYTDGLMSLYLYPENHPGLTYLSTVAGTHIFRLDE